MNLKRALIAALAALAIGGTAVPADAGYRYGGGFHGGYRGGYHGGWRGGGWGPGLGILGLGLAAGAIAGGAYYGGYGDDGCYRYRPIYDEYGDYVGRRLVNVCY